MTYFLIKRLLFFFFQREMYLWGLNENYGKFLQFHRDLVEGTLKHVEICSSAYNDSQQHTPNGKAGNYIFMVLELKEIHICEFLLYRHWSICASLSLILSSPQSLLDRFARSICGIRHDGRGSQWRGWKGQKEGQRWVGGRAEREKGRPGSSSAQSPQKTIEKKLRSTWNLDVETDHSQIWDLSKKSATYCAHVVWPTFPYNVSRHIKWLQCGESEKSQMRFDTLTFLPVCLTNIYCISSRDLKYRAQVAWSTFMILLWCFF